MEKLEDFGRRSFINDNPQAAWCPGTNCRKVAFCTDTSMENEPLDIYCDCGNVSCFHCHEEGHRPVIFSFTNDFPIAAACRHKDIIC